MLFVVDPGCLLTLTSVFFLPEVSNRKVVSHEAMLGGKLAARTSYTLNRSTGLRLEDLTGRSPLFVMHTMTVAVMKFYSFLSVLKTFRLILEVA